VLGPPGSGKGTQARLLAGHLGIVHVSVGAVLRAEIAAGSELGTRIAATVASGDLVPLADVLAVLRAPLADAARRGGWVLDGAPRTVEQAVALGRMFGELDAPVDVVVALIVGDAEVTVRLRDRAQGEHRVDDTADVIAHRLEVWARLGPPLLAWYEGAGLLVSVDGTGSVALVAARITTAVEGFRRDDTAAHAPRRSASIAFGDSGTTLPNTPRTNGSTGCG